VLPLEAQALAASFAAKLSASSGRAGTHGRGDQASAARSSSRGRSGLRQRHARILCRAERHQARRDRRAPASCAPRPSKATREEASPRRRARAVSANEGSLMTHRARSCSDKAAPARCIHAPGPQPSGGAFSSWGMKIRKGLGSLSPNSQQANNPKGAPPILSCPMSHR
jgi:hypothetical protein